MCVYESASVWVWNICTVQVQPVWLDPALNGCSEPLAVFNLTQLLQSQLAQALKGLAML